LFWAAVLGIWKEGFRHIFLNRSVQFKSRDSNFLDKSSVADENERNALAQVEAEREFGDQKRPRTSDR